MARLGIDTEGLGTRGPFWICLARERFALFGLAAPQTRTFGLEPWGPVANPNDPQAMRNDTETYAYDRVGNFEELVHSTANSAETWTRTYTTDAASNRLAGMSLSGAGADPYTNTFVPNTPRGPNPHGSMQRLAQMALDWHLLQPRLRWRWQTPFSRIASHAVHWHNGRMSSAAVVLDPAFPGIEPAVLEAYRQAPDNVVAEILDGALSLMPRPRPRQAKTAARIAGALRGFHDPDDDEPGGWVVLIEPELHLGSRPDIIDPDLAGWHRARLPEEPAEAAVRVAPDWVCEILSDRTEATDRGPKRRIYRQAGVGHLWLCDPRIQTLEVYRLEGGRWMELDTFEGNVKIRVEPFETIELDLERIWRW